MQATLTGLLAWRAIKARPARCKRQSAPCMPYSNRTILVLRNRLCPPRVQASSNRYATPHRATCLVANITQAPHASHAQHVWPMAPIALCCSSLVPVTAQRRWRCAAIRIAWRACAQHGCGLSAKSHAQWLVPRHGNTVRGKRLIRAAGHAATPRRGCKRRSAQTDQDQCGRMRLASMTK